MYYKTCYETSVGRIFNTKALDRALYESLITGGLQSRRFGVENVGNVSAVFVIGGNTDENLIPSFTHPYLIGDFKGRSYLITDLRLFRTSNLDYMSEHSFEVSVRNKAEYGLVKARAVLSLMWLDEAKREKLRSQFKFAAAVYASWLSQAISRTYALDFHDQALITAIGIYYYHTLFIKEARLSGNELETAVIHTIKATKLPAQDVYQLFEQLREVHSITDYCEAVKDVVSNVRLKDFNLAMLLTQIRNTWFGTNAKDLLSVALEHPPTWISIVFSTLTERSYKGSALYSIIEFCGRRGNADEFRMNFLDLLRSNVVALESVENELHIPDFE